LGVGLSIVPKLNMFHLKTETESSLRNRIFVLISMFCYALVFIIACILCSIVLECVSLFICVLRFV
jgi:hypothetical protein